MGWSLRLLTAALVVATSVTASQRSTEARPNDQLDLSGTWNLVPITADPLDAGGAPLGRTVTIIQTETDLNITTTANFTAAQQRLAYRMDGSEVTQTVSAGGKETRSQTATIKWTERTLVITTKWALHEKITTCVLDEPNELTVKSVTSMLTEKASGQLTMATIAFPARKYRRDSK